MLLFSGFCSRCPGITLSQKKYRAKFGKNAFLRTGGGRIRETLIPDNYGITSRFRKKMIPCVRPSAGGTPPASAPHPAHLRIFPYLSRFTVRVKQENEDRERMLRYHRAATRRVSTVRSSGRIFCVPVRWSSDQAPGRCLIHC